MNLSYSQSSNGKCVIPKYTEDKSWIYNTDMLKFEDDRSAFYYFMDIPAFNLTPG